MRIAFCQIDPTIGALHDNADRILADARRAAEEGADLAVFPELALVGYPPRDLLDRPAFVDAAERAVERLVAELPPSLTTIVGVIGRSPSDLGARLRNEAIVVRGGRVVATYAKQLLPTYDVFDEGRWFAPGNEPLVVEIAGRRVGISICEDIWNEVISEVSLRRYSTNPIRSLVDAGADVIVNIAASPFTIAKREGRAKMLSEVARLEKRPVVFVNQVGGNDDLLFEGASALFGPDGSVLARLPSFATGFAVADLEHGGTLAPVPPSEEAAMIDALVMGVRDFVTKTGFAKVVVGLSGGVDSALTAAIAVRALGPENVLGVAMPTRYSSEGSLRDAQALADALRIDLREVPIDEIFQTYLNVMPGHLDALSPPPNIDVTYENVQARIRCTVLMAFANRDRRLVLATGNKSEVAVGYCTLYGDMAGALAVISDVLKTRVYALARELNRQAGTEIIPESTLTKPPSAELRPGQRDVDSLPPYDVLDPILEGIIERSESEAELVDRGFDSSLVRRINSMIQRAEHKRRQLPPGLILTGKAFGPGRRLPIAAAATDGST